VGSATIAELCGNAYIIAAKLDACICMGNCAASCAATYCQGQPTTPACNACILDTSAAGCGQLFQVCQLN
jgi:hypothetical protein